MKARRFGGIWGWGTVVMACALGAVPIAILVARRPDVGGDFFFFWHAGRHFRDGLALYGPGSTSWGYIHPPFAAFLYQIFGIFPLATSRVLFAWVNTLLLPVCVVLCHLIFRSFPSGQGLRNDACVWIPSILVSASYFAHNLRWLQVSGVLFLVVLLAIWAALRGRDLLAGVLLALAAAVKLVPGVFVLWLILRRSRTSWLAAVTGLLICTALPIMVRGVDTGIKDLQDCAGLLATARLQGEGAQLPQNQSLPAVLQRLLGRDAPDLEGRDISLLHLPRDTVETVRRLICLCLGSLYAYALLRLRRKRIPVGPMELACGFLLGFLLTGILWKHYLVAMLFIFGTFLSLPRAGLTRFWKAAFGVSLAGMAISGLCASNLVGRMVNDTLVSIGLMTWAVLLSFLTGVGWMLRTSGGPASLPASPTSSPASLRAPASR
jgi:hypothetical protein